MKKNRVIIHIDMDAFFASIEQLDNPSYRGKPVIVGADPEGGKGRGVVSTASYEARKFGIHSAMPISKAYRLCPHGIFLRPRMERYTLVSRKIMTILGRYSPLIEQISIDEAFLDVTGTEKLFGSPLSIAKRIKNDIKRETGLTASVGIASLKRVAKIASDLCKPDGVLYVEHGKEREFLSELDLKYLWGAGSKTIEVLKKAGYQKIGDISSMGVEKIKNILGKTGVLLWELSSGIDDRPVMPPSRRKSIGKETTFREDIGDDRVVELEIVNLADKLTYEMLKKGIRGRTVTLKIRLEDFSTYTRRKTVERATNSFKSIKNTAVEIFRSFDKRGKRVRLIGISVSNLEFDEDAANAQQSLFKGNLDISKEDRVQTILKDINKRFGEKVKRAIFIDRRE